MPANLAHQDWNTVVVHKRPAAAAASGGAERRAGGNKAAPQLGQRARKLADETEEFKHDLVGHALKIRIMKARQAKGMTQKELAQRLNAKPATVNDYELGRAIPDNAVLGKMERALGVKLRGKASAKPAAAAPKKTMAATRR
jgi:putative transcription factor